MESVRQVRVQGHEGDGDVDGFLEMMEGLKEQEQEPEPLLNGEIQKDDVNPSVSLVSVAVDSTGPQVV
jgi:hypothetical protein